MAYPTVSLNLGDGLAGEVVVLTAFAGSSAEAGRLSRRLSATLRRAQSQPGWSAKPKQVARATTGGADPVQVEVHGLGKRTEFDDRRLGEWLKRTLKSLVREGRKEASIILPDHPVARGRQALRILVQLLGSGYQFNRFQSRRSPSGLRKIHLVPPTGDDNAYREALGVARPVARGVKTSRDLANTPPNVATPAWIAAQAEQLAAKRSIDCQILGPGELEEMGMGGILAVGKGSTNPPRLVRLEWGDGEEVTALVGKGVTFDTGGISIKPSAAMDEMKYDKCGACTVLGAVQTLSELRLPGRYRAYVPLAENMPDGASYRPSDIVRCFNGKTVEILNTDAEGRMLLADAMAWAAEEKAATLVELSTLTGATVVALGSAGSALYTPDAGLADELIEAGRSSGERLWRMPLWPEFKREMKGVHADLRNLGSRWGGANSAAAFLANFVGKTRRWAHLDIAGTAYRGIEEGSDAGATGFGVALLADWLLHKSGRI